MSPKERHKESESAKRRAELVADVAEAVAAEVASAVAAEVAKQLKAQPPHDCIILSSARRAGMWAGITIFGAFLVAIGSGIAYVIWEGTKALIHAK